MKILLLCFAIAILSVNVALAQQNARPAPPPTASAVGDRAQSNSAVRSVRQDNRQQRRGNRADRRQNIQANNQEKKGNIQDRRQNVRGNVQDRRQNVRDNVGQQRQNVKENIQERRQNRQQRRQQFQSGQNGAIQPTPANIANSTNPNNFVPGTNFDPASYSNNVNRALSSLPVNIRNRVQQRRQLMQSLTPEQRQAVKVARQEYLDKVKNITGIDLEQN